MTNNQSLRIAGTVLVSLLVMMLTACGFQLRGKIELPPEMKKVYIKSTNLRLAGQLARSLRSSGATTVKQQSESTATLEIYKIRNTKSVRSVGGTGRVREYRLSYSVTFGIRSSSGSMLMKKQTATLTRDYSFDESRVVGKSVEESIIRDEMFRQMIGEILRRIQFQVGKHRTVKSAASNKRAK